MPGSKSKSIPKVGSRAQVWHGNAVQTKGGLCRGDLVQNKYGRIVSKKKQTQGRKLYKKSKENGTLAPKFTSSSSSSSRSAEYKSKKFVKGKSKGKGKGSDDDDDKTVWSMGSTGNELDDFMKSQKRGVGGSGDDDDKTVWSMGDT